MKRTTTDVRPLRGVRFDPRYSGPVGPLLAPPYDVASAPAPGARFSIAEIENADLGVAGDQHAVAAARYREWLRRGVLRRDDRPAVYLHEHHFDAEGSPTVRTAVFARVRLEDWTARVVLPHERTMPGPRRERGERLRATGANLSPLYFLYRDPEGEVRDLVTARLGADETPLERDQVGGGHRLVPVEGEVFHRELGRLLRSRPLFVADGHHRYEAALAYRDEQRRRFGHDPDAPWEFVLAMLAAVEDPGVLVRPTHRLVLGDGDVRPRLREILGRWFDIEPMDGEAPLPDDGSSICRVMLGDGHGALEVRARPAKPHLALLPRERGEAWRSLPVAAVQGVLESALGGRREGGGARVAYAIDEGEAVRRVAAGEAQAAFLLPPPRLDRLLAVAEEGDLLPAKSTWFEPKAPAGLVINDLGNEARRTDE
jgi:uncharacterized protein (DUF1015 family)